jgi:hypothetical protein
LLSGLFKRLEKADAIALEAVFVMVAFVSKFSLSGFTKLPKAKSDINWVVFSFTFLSFKIKSN